MSTKRPNILFLMSDEHRADICGYAGNSIIRTPVLDSLAHAGTVFTNAYTPSPICVPGRMAMMAGQFPRTCNCERYGQDLEPGYMTWAKCLSQYAYITTACGKLHHMGSDQMQGWRRRIGMDDMLIHGHRHIEGAKEEEFEKHLPAPETTRKWTDAEEIKHAGIAAGPHTEIWDEYATQGMLNVIDEYFVDSSYKKTKSHFPHALYLGLNNPHYPYFAQKELYEYYLDKVEPYFNQKPVDHPWLGKSPFMPGHVSIGPDGDVTKEEVQRATAAYYANIEACDIRFRRVLDKLKASGENLDDWVIIYTTDHGEMLGEHAIWEKQKFFEGSTRVPLIIRWPKGIAAPSTVDQNVSLCDLFATICNICNIETPKGLDSRSLLPLMQGDTSNWDNEAVSQFGGKHLMIKQDDLKYQYYGEDLPEVLFDLGKDPKESTNCMENPNHSESIRSFRLRKTELGF